MRLPLDLREHFRRFMEAEPGRIHLAAHSHHYWPDVAFEAQKEAWIDAALLADEKWDPIFSELMPAVQLGIAGILNLPDPASIAFAPNTHEFLRRLLSALPGDRPSRILTSDGEFHSLTRQLARLEEDGLVVVERIATEPFSSFEERFCGAAGRGGHDLVYVSQVFFDSGAASGELTSLVEAVRDPETMIAIDGYHGFMALPTDVSSIAGRAFYLAGGYKYAMAGEGACFMHCPPGVAPRPRDTGWFAAFGALTSKQSGVPFGDDGTRFLGATFDPSGLYRMRAVFEWMGSVGLTVADVHEHAILLQKRLLAGLDVSPTLAAARLVTPAERPPRGSFLTFATPHAAELHEALMARRVVTDVRGDRIRFGFGCYLVPEDVDRALARLSGL